MKLQNKKALVTGGSRGIGRAIVLELAKNGCDIVFTCYSPDEAGCRCDSEASKLVESEVEAYGVKVFSIKADASSFSDAEKTLNFTLEKLGGLDILVNNAGITKDNLLLRMTEDDFDLVISTNLKSVFNYTKVAVKSMMSQRYGKIINIASVVGIIGNAGQANYVASKAGVIGFTKATAKEFASRNITVNAVAPGFISTNMTGSLNDKQKEAILAVVPLKRTGTPEDIARVVSFLASADADYLTGQVISVDGGMAM
ncbi:MAG: 3-oxoacyl-[acyl-carrier-protein] reductase [Ignavibacteria bacterium]|nr:3-oxoacyl-[acyl-carrier-protein] reductase [Ignavibacteria bacterium]